MIVAYDKDELA